MLEPKSVNKAFCKAQIRVMDIWNVPGCSFRYGICHFECWSWTMTDDSQFYSNVLSYYMIVLCYYCRWDGGEWQYVCYELESVRFAIMCDGEVNAISNIPYLYKNVFLCLLTYGRLYFAFFVLYTVGSRSKICWQFLFHYIWQWVCATSHDTWRSFELILVSMDHGDFHCIIALWQST